MDAVDRLERTQDLPELVWLRIIGPVEVDAVASIVTVYRAPSEDEASVLNDQRVGIRRPETRCYP